MVLTLSFISPGDKILPGRFVFICWNARKNHKEFDIRNYWFAVVITEDLLPKQVAAARPETAIGQAHNGNNNKLGAQNQLYPVWLVGKGNFQWISLSEMCYFSRSTISEFQGTKMYLHILDLYKFATAKHGLEFYLGDIAADRRTFELKGEPAAEEELILTPKSTMKRKVIDEETERAFSPAKKHGRKAKHGNPFSDRRSGSRAADRRDRFASDKFASCKWRAPSLKKTAAPAMLGDSPSAAVTIDELGGPSFFGDDDKHGSGNSNNNDKNNNLDDRVDIYVGTSTETKFQCSASLLAQSPILSSYIQQPPGTNKNPPFIMNPSLTGILHQDFEAVVEFLKSGEYEPHLMREEGQDDDDVVEEGEEDIQQRGLDGYTEAEQYAEELGRSGRLYVLAKQFQLPKMTKLVFKKVSLAMAKGFHFATVLDVATMVFLSPYRLSNNNGGQIDEVGGRASTAVVATGDDDDDDMEIWLVDFLAEHMRPLTLAHGAGFWDTMDLDDGEVGRRVFGMKAQLMEEQDDSGSGDDDDGEEEGKEEEEEESGGVDDGDELLVVLQAGEDGVKSEEVHE